MRCSRRRSVSAARRANAPTSSMAARAAVPLELRSGARGPRPARVRVACTTSPGHARTRIRSRGALRLLEAGAAVTDVIDREYFTSIYFREPVGGAVRDRHPLPGLRRRRGSRASGRAASLAGSLRAPTRVAGEVLHADQIHDPPGRPSRRRRDGSSAPATNPGAVGVPPRTGERSLLRRAPVRRRARRPADPPSRSRERRARHARPRRRSSIPRAVCTPSCRARPSRSRAGPDTTGTRSRGWAIRTRPPSSAPTACLAALHDELWERTGIPPSRTVLGGFSMGAS